jgi:hypothetical protein
MQPGSDVGVGRKCSHLIKFKGGSNGLGGGRVEGGDDNTVLRNQQVVNCILRFGILGLVQSVVICS